MAGPKVTGLDEIATIVEEARGSGLDTATIEAVVPTESVSVAHTRDAVTKRKRKKVQGRLTVR